MSITLTATKGNLYTFPYADEDGLFFSYFTVTEAAPSTFTAVIDAGDQIFTLRNQGAFTYTGDMVGTNLADTIDLISSAAVSQYSFITTDGSGEVLAEETTAYSSPIGKDQWLIEGGQTYEDRSTEFAGNDVFRGSVDFPDDDIVHGYGGNDRFVMTYGDNNGDVFRGGDGVDTAVLPSARANWEINTATVYNELDGTNNLSGYAVRDVTLESGNSLDIAEVERLEFTDTKVALDIDGSAGQTAKTLAAVIGADGLSNKEYIGVGLQLFDAGQSLASVCELALTVVGSTSHADVVNLLYTNLFGEAPTEAQAQEYISALDAGVFTKGSLAAAAAELTDDLGVIDLVGLAETGIEYV